MSDLVGNPKDRFSHEAAHVEGTGSATNNAAFPKHPEEEQKQQKFE